MPLKVRPFFGKLLGKETATRLSEPDVYNALPFLPNPDSVLRQLGKSQEVYGAIILDAHVIGELRPMRANIIAQKWHILPGGDKPEDLRAFGLAQKVYNRHPVPALAGSPGMGWPDVFWAMQVAVLQGQRVHEVVWEPVDGLLEPVSLIDRPNRRFVYGLENELRLLTRDNRTQGDPVAPYKFLVSRHMPGFDNPYGVALLSSCFWPYVFKHNGFRYFTKFCEKYGIPWAVGKYPAGTAQKEIDALADGLAAMVEDAVAAMPDSGAVQLVGAGASASHLPQERLIQLCNAEMSKAINSQTLATQIKGQASRAAAEVHRGREQGNGAADRKLVEEANNQLLAWLTELNFTGASPPLFRFYGGRRCGAVGWRCFQLPGSLWTSPCGSPTGGCRYPKPQTGKRSWYGEETGLRGHRTSHAPPPNTWSSGLKYSGRVRQLTARGKATGSPSKIWMRVIANFKPDAPPPYMIGHPQGEAPVLGRVLALKRVGLGLWAKGTQIDPQFDKLVGQGRYRQPLKA